MRKKFLIKGAIFFKSLFLVFLTMNDVPVFAQTSSPKITVALANFTNRTGFFFYDRLEQTIPEMLKTEISHSNEIVVLERSKLDAILSEQALGMTGYIDPEKAQKVGRLAGAEFVITGEISKINNRLRIDAHIVRVESGQVLGEKVSGQNLDVINEMVEILANNIVHSLTGQGMRLSKKRISKLPSGWLLMGSAVSGIGAIAAQSSFRNYYDDYKSATLLSDINTNYQNARAAYITRNIFLSAGSAMFITGAIFYYFDHSENRMVLAQLDKGQVHCRVALIPFTDFSQTVGVKLCLGF